MTNRRTLLQYGTAIGALGAAGHAIASIPGGNGRQKSLLILGGTGFIGPHLTRAALAAGWRVTHFNRGRTAKGGVPGVETLIGDRRNQLDALRDRRFDVVIDDSGYVPKFVRASATLLAPNVGYYLFVSSISVYRSFAQPNDEQRGALAELPDPETETLSNETYGAMKAQCEREVVRAFGRRACVLRPGFIVGPLDGSNRFSYWPVRASEGGEMLAPGTPRDPVQFIDVRDLAAFMLRLARTQPADTYNVVTPAGRHTMGELLRRCVEASPAAGTRLRWVPADFLETQWADTGVNLPPWAPASGDTAALGLVPARRAERAGLRTRPVAATVRDVLAWHRESSPQAQLAHRSLLSAAREAQTLLAWHLKQARG